MEKLAKLLQKRLDAVEELCACYRLQRRPSERLFDKLDRTKKALEDLEQEKNDVHQQEK